MKKFLVTAFLVWSFFLLQTAVCPWFAFGGIKPNLLILLTASIGLMEGEKPGMWTGFSCGLLADLFAANGMSLTAASGVGAGGSAGLLCAFVSLCGIFVRKSQPPDFFRRTSCFPSA